jgi:hypothetical protein
VSLYDGLLDWWGLGDYAGNLSTLHDYGPAAHDGTWLSYLGYGQAPGAPAIDPATGVALRCAKDGASFEAFGWNPGGGHGAGTVPDPGGSAWYDAMSFTFNIWTFTALPLHPVFHPCPGTETNLFVTPFGVGNYHSFDRVSYGGATYVCIADYVSDGSRTPADDGDHWTIDDYWTNDCYGDKVAYNRMGVAGDHSGFPSNAGWMIYVLDSFDNPRDGTDSDWIPRYQWRFECESNTAHPPIALDLGTATYGDWNMFTVTNDGTTLRVFRNAGLVGFAPGNRMVTSNAGLDFGFVDRLKALSGQDEMLQGGIDEAMLWDRPLSFSEIQKLFGDHWCKPRHFLHSAHRASPGSGNADASHVAGALHLSGTKFRADPQAIPSSGSGPTVVELAGVSFRSAL